MGRELKVGIFVLAGLVALGLSIFTIKDIRLEKGYTIYIYYKDTGGLMEKAWIRIAGVKVGKIEKIELDDRKAKVTAWVWGNTPIHNDTEANIVATGMLGVKYLALTMGSNEAPLLKNGDSILGIDPLPLDKMISQGMDGLNDLVKTLKNVTGEGDLTENVGELLKNTKEISAKVNSALEGDKLAKMMDNFYDSSQNLSKLTCDLNQVVTENKVDLKKTLSSLNTASEKIEDTLKKVDSGDTMLSKLLSDKKMGDDLGKTVSAIRETSESARSLFARVGSIKTSWNYKMRYDSLNQVFRSDVGILISPRPEKFYYLGVDNVADSGITGTVVNQKENTFTGTIGKDFKKTTVYAGIIRSKGGLGLKWRPLSEGNEKRRLFDRLEIQSEIFDFTRTVPDKKPFVSLGTRVGLTKWFFLGLQSEDLLTQQSMFAYCNVVFEDEDVAYIMGLIGLSKPNY